MAEQDPQERALACAVRPQQADDGTGRHVERNVVEGDRGPEALRHVLEGKCRVVGVIAGPGGRGGERWRRASGPGYECQLPLPSLASTTNMTSGGRPRKYSRN